MNKFFMFFVLVFASANVCDAQETNTFRCVSPADVVKGFGFYLLDTGERVVGGVTDIVKAPFKAKMVMPNARKYRYQPMIFRLPRFVPVPDTVKPKKKPEGTDYNRGMHYPLHRNQILDKNIA